MVRRVDDAPLLVCALAQRCEDISRFDGTFCVRRCSGNSEFVAGLHSGSTPGASSQLFVSEDALLRVFGTCGTVRDAHHGGHGWREYACVQCVVWVIDAGMAVSMLQEQSGFWPGSDPIWAVRDWQADLHGKCSRRLAMSWGFGCIHRHPSSCPLFVENASVVVGVSSFLCLRWFG